MDLINELEFIQTEIEILNNKLSEKTPLTHMDELMIKNT